MKKELKTKRISQKKDPRSNVKFIIVAIFGVVLLAALVGLYIAKPKVDTTVEYSKDNYTFIINNLVTGGPPKDGIPSIDEPVYLTVGESNIPDDEIVYGVNYKGLVAAYPQNIMYWHEIVNEQVEDGELVSVTYCPLTGTIIGYLGHELGVSGELYNSNLVMYDRATDVRIPQILGKAIEGKIQGLDLETFPITVTTWKEWRETFPQTKVLSEETGFNRDYTRNPYPGYDDLLRVWFPINHKNDTLRTKDWVMGIEYEGEYLAIELDSFEEMYGENGLEFTLGGEEFKASWNDELSVIELDKNVTALFESYWFAWYAHHPETDLVKN